MRSRWGKSRSGTGKGAVGPPPCRDRRNRAGRSRVVNYSWVPCLAGSSDTSTSRDDPATLSCLSYRPRQIALKKPRHLPLKVTFEALDDLRQSGHRSLTTGTVSGARDSAVNATLVVP